MTALPSQPERQAEGLNHRNRGQHARARPRNPKLIMPSRPERPLQSLPSHRPQKISSLPDAFWTLKPLRACAPSQRNSRINHPKSRFDLDRETLIKLKNCPEPRCLSISRDVLCPTITRDSCISNQNQTASNPKIINLCFICANLWLRLCQPLPGLGAGHRKFR
jgi:hypothetical protein